MSIYRRKFLTAVAAVSPLGTSGCSTLSEATQTHSDTQGAAIAGTDLTLATTTSTYDSGLLGELNAWFEETFGISVETIARGTGASLRLARDGDADLVLVHARSAENEFMQAGYGINRRETMFNDFVIVGPAEDPAGINGMDSATKALSTIARKKAPFLSRGDDSGTNIRERRLWEHTDVQPGGKWYQLIGQGMGSTLVQAGETDSYTLTDRGTFLMHDNIDLAIHVQRPLTDQTVTLKNPYGVMAVNPAKHEHVNYQAAMAYIGFLTSPRGQSIIANYTVEGEQLFVPTAVREEPGFEQYVPTERTAGSEQTKSGEQRQHSDEQWRCETGDQDR